MIIIKNKIIPFKGFSAIYLFGLLFTKKDLRRAEINHELIHERQAREMLFVFFYLWYLIEWLIRLTGKGNAYHNISFEREAYTNQNNLLYLSKRKMFNFIKYIK